MLITVPTATSKTLANLLSTAQKNIVLSATDNSNFEILIQNLGTTSLYVDYGFNSDVSVSTGLKVPVGDTISCSIDNLSKINLISETSDNVNVRVSITS